MHDNSPKGFGKSSILTSSVLDPGKAFRLIPGVEEKQEMHHLHIWFVSLQKYAGKPLLETKHWTGKIPDYGSYVGLLCH